MAHRHRQATPPPGPAVDARGIPAQDPTANVIAVVGSANKSLRRELKLHMQYQALLAQAEAGRINAIRAVDVAAVATAAAAQEQRANALATQVLANAETLRNTVATTAATGELNFRTALEPMQTDIRALRDAQSAFVASTAAHTESRGDVRYESGQRRDNAIDARTLFFAVCGLALAIITAAALIGAHL
jgi:hypothetical protein